MKRQEKKVLMFGGQDAEVILRAAAAARKCGAEVQSVPREGWRLTLEEAAAGKKAPASAGAVPPGRMLVLCGLEEEVDTLLPALRQAGAAGPAAVLTETNRRWTAQRLYQELMQEQRRMEGR